jgi:hypothetical protein
MAAIRPKKTFGVSNEPSLLRIDPAEVAATEKRGAVDILAIELTIYFRFKKRVYYLQQSTCLGRMAAVGPKNTFGVVDERSLLRIDPAELAATARRSVLDFLAIELTICFRIKYKKKGILSPTINLPW